MKKNKVFLLFFAMLAMSQISFGQNQGSSSQTFSQDYLTFTIKDGNAVVLRCNKEATGEIIIPETVLFDGNTYPVKSIGRFAFHECQGMVSVVIPNSVTDIGDAAFCECTGLTSVKIPNNVVNIGSNAFYQCTGLTSINIPNSVISIGDMAFFNCKSIKNLIVPKSVIKIGNDAFFGVACISYDGELKGTSWAWGARKWDIVDKSKIKTIKDYLYYNNIKATPTPSGLYIIVNKKGQSRKTVSLGCDVTADYIMRQLDGTIIDCSDENLAKQSLRYDSIRDYKPIWYKVGQTHLIKGWREGFMGQTEGSVITLIVPSNLAYGEKGLEPYIAPNTPLIIEITIRRVNCPRPKR